MLVELTVAFPWVVGEGAVVVLFDIGVLLVPFDGTAVLLLVGIALLVGFEVDTFVGFEVDTVVGFEVDTVVSLVVGGAFVVLVLLVLLLEDVPVTVSGRGFNITHGELTSN